MSNKDYSIESIRSMRPTKNVSIYTTDMYHEPLVVLTVEVPKAHKQLYVAVDIALNGTIRECRVVQSNVGTHYYPQTVRVM